MKEQESKDHKPEEGMTRRSFIKSVGVGAAAAAASGTLSAVAAGGEKEVKAEEMQKLTLRVNGGPSSPRGASVVASLRAA